MIFLTTFTRLRHFAFLAIVITDPEIIQRLILACQHPQA